MKVSSSFYSQCVNRGPSRNFQYSKAHIEVIFHDLSRQLSKENTGPSDIKIDIRALRTETLALTSSVHFFASSTSTQRAETFAATFNAFGAD